MKYALGLAIFAWLVSVPAYGGLWSAWEIKDHEARTKCNLGGFAPDPICARLGWGSRALGAGAGASAGAGAGAGTGMRGAQSNWFGADGEASGIGAGFDSGTGMSRWTGPTRPIVICRQKGCTQMNDRMTDSHLFNSIANLLYINDKTRVHLCEADTSTRACVSNGIRYAVNVGGTAGVVHIPSMTITEVTFAQNLRRISFMLSYDLYANGVKSFCTSAHSTIDISRNKQTLIRDNNYQCQLTSDMPSVSHNIYNIDYIDLDYGIIGAYYSIGMSGASMGGASGYVLMKFQHTDTSGVTITGGCAGGPCGNDNHRIAPGQYEVIPLK